MANFYLKTGDALEILRSHDLPLPMLSNSVSLPNGAKLTRLTHPQKPVNATSPHRYEWRLSGSSGAIERALLDLL